MPRSSNGEGFLVGSRYNVDYSLSVKATSSYVGNGLRKRTTMEIVPYKVRVACFIYKVKIPIETSKIYCKVFGFGDFGTELIRIEAFNKRTFSCLLFEIIPTSKH